MAIIYYKHMLAVGDLNNFKTNLRKTIDKMFICECGTQSIRYYSCSAGKYCYLCYILKNIALYDNCITICQSSLSQMDIIRKTVAYVKKNMSVPYPYQIDPTAKIIKINIIELCRLVQKKLIDYYKIKIFYNNECDFSNIGLSLSIFSEDEKVADSGTPIIKIDFSDCFK